MGACEEIRAKIRELESRLELLDQLIHEEDDLSVKKALMSERGMTTWRLNREQADLRECLAGAGLKQVRIYGSEVTQGLPAYELVAGKDALARLFIGPRPPVATPVEAVLHARGPGTVVPKWHLDLPTLNTVHLDYAELEVKGPDGRRFLVPGHVGDGTFSNTTQSFSEEDNVNFYIGGENLSRPGRYSFTCMLYRDGEMLGAVPLGAHEFHPTKDLRLLIVVDTWPMPARAWATLDHALAYVHRNFPVRAGVGPLDGSPQNGLRYRIDPRPFDPAFPGWGPVRKRLDDFNADQQAKGRPDRAEHIMTVRVQQDFEAPLGGAAEGGPGGRVSGVTLNVRPPADQFFATLIAQEIGHNFLGNSHSADATIGEPSAFNVLDRTAISGPRSIMFGYYTATPNEVGLFLPPDWNKIRDGLLATASTGPS